MAEGMRLLREAGATFFIHCGDVGSEAVLDPLAGEPSAFVFGNTDWDQTPLRAHAEMLGVQCLGAFGTVELEGKKIAVLHGDDAQLLDRLIKEQQHDFLTLGHSHVPGKQQVGKTLVLNPGALHRAKPKTVAILDLETSTVRWIEVE